MEQLNYLVMFLASATYLAVLCKEEIVQTIYAKGARCNFSEKYVYPNYSCFAKSYSRTVSTYNAMGTYKKPMNNIFTEAKLFYKYGTIYREVIHTPKGDWCKLMEDYLYPKMPSPLSVILQLINDTAPEMVQKCPYQRVRVVNRTVNLSALKSVFPTGQYKLSFEYFAGVDDYYGFIHFFFDINSPLKETFG